MDSVILLWCLAAVFMGIGSQLYIDPRRHLGGMLLAVIFALVAIACGGITK